MARRGKIRRTRNIKHTADAMQRKSGSQPNLSVDVDWKSTFREFCRLHGEGRWPIEHGGQLLFPDGWRIATTSYRGPVTPSPTDKVELARLKRAYFSHSVKACRWFLFHLETTIERLANQCDAMHMRVMVRNSLRDDDGKVMGDPSVELDMQALMYRRDEVKAELAYCQKELEASEAIIRRESKGERERQHA